MFDSDFTLGDDGFWYAPEKAPADVLDYSIDWRDWLEDGDTIASSSWVVPSGISGTVQSLSADGLVTTIWLSGGTIGITYTLKNLIITTSSRQYHQYFKIKIKEN